MMMMMVSSSTAGMNNSKGMSNKALRQQQMQQQQWAQSEQDYSDKGKGKGVRLEKSQKSAQFSKTEMCKFHLLGICTKGSSCAFAHAESDLKSRPDLSCTRLCREFLQNGQCSDKNCSFAHSKDELRTTDFFHKTKLCKFWQAGHCILDDKCRFAHTTQELREDAKVTDKPQQPNQQGARAQQLNQQGARPQQPNQQDNTCMPIPVMLNQIQFLLQQREQLQQQLQAQEMQQQMQSRQKSRKNQYQKQPPKDVYSGCATPEYNDFDAPPMRALYPVPLQGSGPYLKPICGYQVSDGMNSMSTCASGPTNGSDSETEFTEFTTDPTWEHSDGSRTPDFPAVYGEEQVPVQMMPHSQGLPQLLVPHQQMSPAENETGDDIEHYMGDLEIMQGPLPDETLDSSMDDIWQSNSDYQVKNTFISIDEKSVYKPLRCVRSAAGRLTEMQNLS
jgi:hypothetical protein